MSTRLPGINLTGLVALSGVLMLLASSCSDSRIFNEYRDFDESAWQMDSTQEFSFSIKNIEDDYRIYYLVRNTADYSYYNLYLKYTIEDSIHQVIESKLQEVVLFDPKTGKPYGGGLGDIFSHEFPSVEKISFPYQGTFTFSVQQYMRTESLSGIQAVGLRVERIEQE